jgi:hypothetical protein
MKTYPIDSTFTMKDLMQVLEDMDPLASVMVTVHPLLPFEHGITGVVSDCNGTVYLATLNESLLLSREAKEAFEVAGIPFPVDR